MLVVFCCSYFQLYLIQIATYQNKCYNSLHISQTALTWHVDYLPHIMPQRDEHRGSRLVKLLGPIKEANLTSSSRKSLWSTI